MHSKLFQIGPLEIHSYGLMLALSFLIGIYFLYFIAFPVLLLMSIDIMRIAW